MSLPSPDWTAGDVLAHLKTLGSEENRAGMARFGIRTDSAFGVGHSVLRPLARKIGRDHDRALRLWESGWREARLLAAFSEEPAKVTVGQCRRWAADFDSWEIVDGVADLFVDMPFWRGLIEEFAEDKREFVRRTAFAMLAWAAVHRKKEPDATFLSYLPLIEAHSTDSRNFVRKAVNWALRQTGKRSPSLHGPALELARRLAGSPDRTVRWIGKDAFRELSAAKTIARLTAKASKVGYAAGDDASFSSTR